MIVLRTTALLLTFAVSQTPSAPTGTVRPRTGTPGAGNLRDRIQSSPTLPFNAVHLTPTSSSPGWKAGSASGVAIDAHGTIYEISRGGTSGPILVLNTKGRVLRSWGSGDFELPHSIRIDPSGSVWTVDAGSSNVIQYSPLGKKLLTIHVGELTPNGSPFHGATDIAFGPNRRLYITDGYSNARVLEYTREGKRVAQWGKPGSGPGEFHLPHALEIDEHGTIYVADRENGRIQKFDLDGRYLGQIPNLGRIYSLKLAGKMLWATMQTLDQEPGSAGSWIIKLDRDTGKLVGHIDIPDARAGHSLDLTPSGEPIITLGNGLLWLKLRQNRSDVEPNPHLRK